MLIAEGKSIFDFNISGPAIRIDRPTDYIGKTEGKIIFLSHSRPDVIVIMRSCLAIVSDDGGLVSHLAIMGKEIGVPTIVGAMNSYDRINDGMLVNITAKKGVGKIYAL